MEFFALKSKTEILARLEDPELLRKNREAGLKLLAEVNAALGLPVSANDPNAVSANASRKRYSPQAFTARVAEYFKLRDAAVGSTLHADIWAAWNARTYR